MKGRLVVGCAVVLTLFAFPVLADPSGPAPEILAAAIFSAAPGPGNGACALPPVVETATAPEFGQASTCTAWCWDGTTRSCTGTSCSAVDSSCSAQRGYCWSNSTGYNYCPTCPSGQTCTASCAGAGGGSVSCTTTTGDCYTINDCYAYCDGNYYFCPNPPHACPL